MANKLKVYLPRSEAGILPDPTTGVLRTICINDEWLQFLQGQLHHLRWRGKYWDGDEPTIIQNHEYVEKLLTLLAGEPDVLCGQSAPYTSNCRRLLPNSPRIRWAPGDPFTDPQPVPNGYYDDVWKLGGFELAAELPLIDTTTEPGDVFPLWNSLRPENIWDFDIFNTIGLVDSGLPRFEFDVEGKAEIFFGFVAIPFGGAAIAYYDNNPLTVKFFDLQTLDAGDLIEVDDMLTGNIFTLLGLAGLNPLASYNIERTYRYVVEDPGPHTVKVQFIPKPAGPSSIGAGGGLRFIQICETLPTENVGMGLEDVRFNPETCQVEAQIDGAWVPKFSLLEGLQLSATTLAAGEAATVSADDCGIEFGIPQGEQGEPGASAPLPNYHFSQPSDNIVYLQIDTDGSGGYDVQSPNLKGPQGIQGEPGGIGPQGIQGPPGECDCDDDIAPPVADTTAKICGGVSALVTWYAARWGDLYTLLSAIDPNYPYLDSAYAEATLSVLSNWGIGYSTFLLLWSNYLETGGFEYDYLTDEEDLAEIKCQLYCAILDNGNAFDVEWFIEYTSDLWAGSGRNQFLGYFMRLFGYGKAAERYSIGTLIPSTDCELCDCNADETWEHVITNEDVLSGMVIIHYGLFNLDGSVQSGCQAATWEGAGKYRAIVHLEVVGDLGASRITRLYAQTSDSWTTKQRAIYGAGASNLIVLDELTHAAPWMWYWDFPPETGLYFWMAGEVVSGAGCSDSWSMTFTLQGTGINPFL